MISTKSLIFSSRIVLSSTRKLSDKCSKVMNLPFRSLSRSLVQLTAFSDSKISLSHNVSASLTKSTKRQKNSKRSKKRKGVHKSPRKVLKK